jgi:AraC-like DNA-binding protein
VSAVSKRPSSRDRVLARSFRDADRVDRRLPPRWHALLTGGYVVSHLRGLNLPCCVIPETCPNVWLKIWSTESNVAAFDVLFGGEAARSEYNHECLEKVRRTKRPFVGSFHGFYDLFVPIVSARGIDGFFACGPICREALDAPGIVRRFAELAGRTPRHDDPDLLRYAAAVLATPSLDGPVLAAATKYLIDLAKALVGSIDFAELRRRHVRLGRRYFARQFTASMWGLARGLVDPLTHANWSANFRSWDRENLGITRLPTLVIAVAPVAAPSQDALESLVSAGRFSRRCFDVALGMDETVCAATEGGLVYFLTYCDPALPERRARTAALARARSIEHATHVALRAGIGLITADPRDLPKSLDQAVRALEWAVHKGRSVVFYADEAGKRATADATAFASLPVLLRAVASGERGPRDRALEQLANEIVWQAGSLLVAARAYTDAIFSQVVHAVRSLAVLEPRHIADQTEAFRQALERAKSAADAARALRDHVTALSDAQAGASGARRDKRLGRAIAYIDEHLASPVTIREAAKAAGYAPDYFTRLLRAREGRTFEQHMLARRIARAKELLRTSTLAIAQVAAASGFRTEAYFYRAFRRAAGRTPHAFRLTARGPGGFASAR